MKERGGLRPPWRNRPKSPRSAAVPGVALIGFGLALGCWLAGSRAVAANAVEFLPIDQVEVGMRGVGRTVFQGSTIEEFEVEILGVLENTRPQGDLILFRAHGDLLEHAGIIRGMSGSPVYIGGKLVGAVSFAYPGTMDPIGAITPIGEMLPLLEAATGPGPERDRREGATIGKTGAPSAMDSDSDGGGLGSWSDFESAWQEFLAPMRTSETSAFLVSDRQPAAMLAGSNPISRSRPWTRQAVSIEDPSALTPLATPVSMSGWSTSLVAPMARALQDLGFAAAALPGGSAGRVGVVASSGDARVPAPGASAGAPGALEPGSSLGIQLIGGDADLVAIGTVTYVDSERLLAFGHPMMQAGDVSFPMTGAWIHTVVPNRTVSMKMGSSTKTLGGVWNDRRTGVAGALGPVPSVLPVHVTIGRGEGDREEFHYTVARHQSLTPFLLPWTVANSYLVSGWVSGDAYLETTTDVYFDGGRRLRRVDRVAAEAPGVELGANVTLPAALLLINPWQDTHLDSLRVEVDYRKGNRSARVVEVLSSAARVRVGEQVRLTAVVEPFRGTSELVVFDLEVPESWAGRSLEVYVGATNDFTLWDQDRAPDKLVPHDLEHMISLIETVPDDSQIGLRVYASERGTLIRGRELPDLPPSLAKATLDVASVSGARSISGSLLEERHHSTRWVLSGGQSVPLEVAEQ